MRQFNVIEVVKSLAGDLEIYCESSHDREVLENLDTYEELLTHLCGMIRSMSKRDTDDRGSAREIGKKAERIRQNLLEYLERCEDNG